MRTELDFKMGKWIVDQEARRDAKGRLMVYKLPSGDGGGTFEVAGINDRYHPTEAANLKRLIMAGKYQEAEDYARSYVLSYTDGVEGWTTNPGVEAFLRDSTFNRGPGGAAKIAQMALGFTGKDLDGRVGPITKAAIKAVAPIKYIQALRKAREQYERQIAPPVGSRAKFWNGLVNRWNAAEKFALGLA
jgi:lysozyme family protein